MAQLGQRFRLDLADALAGNAELAANFLERARMAIFQAETQADNLALAFGQALERFRKLLLEHAERSGIGRNDSGVVFDEVAQLRIFFLADGRFQGNRFLADLLDLAHAFRRKAHFLGDFFRGRFAAQGLQQLALNAHQLVDGFHHVHGNADGTGLIGDGARDGLTDPPGGVRGELEALGVVELLYRADKAKVAFLDKVEEQHAAANVALRDGHNKTKVSFDKLLLRIQAHLLDASKAPAFTALKLDALLFGLLKLLGCGNAGLDLHSKVDFLCRGKQGNLADFLQVHTNRVAGEQGNRRIRRRFAGASLTGALSLMGNLGNSDLRSGLELFLGYAFEQAFVGKVGSLHTVFVIVFQVGGLCIGLQDMVLLFVHIELDSRSFFRLLLGGGCRLRLGALLLRGGLLLGSGRRRGLLGGCLLGWRFLRRFLLCLFLGFRLL